MWRQKGKPSIKIDLICAGSARASNREAYESKKSLLKAFCGSEINPKEV